MDGSSRTEMIGPMRKNEPVAPRARLWPASTSILLLLVGLILSAVSLVAVVSVGPAPWHGARDAELRATYEAYQDTGTLLIKATGSGSYGVQAAAPGPLTFATWDDDPGAYIIASLMSDITGSDNPYYGLMLAQGLLVALPLLFLPTAVARMFKRARAGFALLLIPVVLWAVNHGAVLLGTEYGLSDSVSTLRVYALYGMAASFAFLSLTLIFFLSTYRLRLRVLIGATLAIGVLAGFGNLTRSLSGMGVAAAVGVLWWLSVRGRLRWVAAVSASLIAITLATVVSTGVMSAINTTRVATTGQSITDLPNAHAAWHSLYLGLSYPQPLTDAPSTFDVTWSDEFAWEKAKEVDPGVLIQSEKYDDVLKGLYFDKVLADPVGAAKLYVVKAMFVVQHFGAMIAFIVIGLVAILMRIRQLRRPVATVLIISFPTFVLGLIPPVLVMPMLYYYSELSAVLGLLTAVSLGGLVWWLTSIPSLVRETERKRLRERNVPEPRPLRDGAGVNAIIPCHDVDDTVTRTINAVGAQLVAGDELIIVHSAATDATRARLNQLVEGWPHAALLRYLQSPAGLGDALRAGALTSSGRWLTFIFGENPQLDKDVFSTFVRGNNSIVLATTGAPRSNDRRDWRGPRVSRLGRLIREASLRTYGIDGHDTVTVAADWGRSFAEVSRESNFLWLDELVMTATSQGLTIITAPQRADSVAETTPRWVRFADGWRSLYGVARLALRRDEFRDEVWTQEPVVEIKALQT